MKEIRELNEAVSPVETLFVVDAMTGQDAANTAKAFSEALPLTLLSRRLMTIASSSVKEIFSISLPKNGDDLSME